MQAVAVPSRIDVDNALEVLATLSAALSGGSASPGVTAQPQALDLAPLQQFDSSALSLLLQLARSRRPLGDNDGNAGARQEAGVPLFLLNPPAKLQELAQLYGVEEMLFGSQSGTSRPSGGVRVPH